MSTSGESVRTASVATGGADCFFELTPLPEASFGAVMRFPALSGAREASTAHRGHTRCPNTSRVTPVGTGNRDAPVRIAGTPSCTSGRRPSTTKPGRNSFSR